MTIRRRLNLSYLVILLLFGVNLVIYFWGNQRRGATVEVLRRAITRQALISQINQDLNDIQKQVSLLSQIAPDSSGDSGAAPEEVAQFTRQLENAGGQIEELRALSDGEALATIDNFSRKYRDLSASWKIFFENSGVNQTKAITELAVRAEPLAQEVLQERLPQMQTDVKARVDMATDNFYAVARFTDRMIIMTFAVSIMVAIGVAVAVSGQLTRGLLQLKAGAGLIASGNLNHQIKLAGNDELVDLGTSFNNMSAALAKAQDQLLVQQKLASLGALTAGIAHEIKNPLNFVTNFAEVAGSLTTEIEEALASPDVPKAIHDDVRALATDLRGSVAKIQEHGKRADGIVRNMLMHSRGKSGERRLTDINALLAEYVKLAYHGMRAQDAAFNVTLKESYDASVEPMTVVSQDLSRVFLNIVNNACYAAYTKKKTIGDGFQPIVSVSTRNTDSHVEIRIRDNGDGIPPEVVKRVFEPFFTTKPAGSGTGLGLSLSHDIIVQQHKGKIEIETEAGQFAEFTISLPKDTPA
jgi:signal transduction histidine kinase